MPMIDPAKQMLRRRLDARPDVLDLRDRWYASGASGGPSHRLLADYQKHHVPVLDQAADGGCAAFALASIVNYLVCAAGNEGVESASPWMLHEMARRYADDADDDAAISLRCALKGAHRHGVCGLSLWPERAADTEPTLTALRSADAMTRQLAAYCRIDQRDLSSMHAALNEVGILVASAWIHSGWQRPDPSGAIRDGSSRRGACHAFAIVAHDQDGFWIQNTWGRHWGRDGFGHLDYEQWLRHGIDVWATQLSAHPQAYRIREPSSSYGTKTEPDLRPHVVCLDREGRLRNSGRYGNRKADVDAIFRNDIPRATAHWDKRRILLHAGSGLGTESSALQQAGQRLQSLLADRIYPITFLWRSDLRTVLGHLLRSALAEPELARPSARAWPAAPPREDTLESLVRRSLGRTLWSEIKQGALQASARPAGGARLVSGHLAHLLATDPDCELHIWAHGGGAILLAPVVCMLATKGIIRGSGLAGMPGFGLRVRSCTLSAPACTLDVFHATYGAAISSGAIARTTLLVREEEARDGWGELYRRSFLRLASNALEHRSGTPLIGLPEVARQDRSLRALIRKGRLQLDVDHAAGAQEEIEGDEAAVTALIARIRRSTTSPAPAASTAPSRACARGR